MPPRQSAARSMLRAPTRKNTSVAIVSRKHVPAWTPIVVRKGFLVLGRRSADAREKSGSCRTVRPASFLISAMIRSESTMRTTSAATGHTVSRSFPAPERAVSSSTRCRKTVCLAFSFQPGGAFPFFRMPACEMENRSMELEFLWPGAANQLRERLLAAPTIDAMFLLAEQYLLAQLVENHSNCIRRSHCTPAILSAPA